MSKIDECGWMFGRDKAIELEIPANKALQLIEAYEAAKQQPDDSAVEDNELPNQLREMLWQKYGVQWSNGLYRDVATLLRRESSWVFVTHESTSLGNLPKHDEQVLFWYGNSLYVGFFLNDIRENSNPEGEKYSGDFGFLTEDDNFYEAEHVLCWMPRPEKPTNQIEPQPPKTEGEV